MNTEHQTDKFVPEERYIILKKKDVQRYFTNHDKEMLRRLVDKANMARIEENRGELRGVVVEDDWPETPVIWSMIEARMTGGVDFVMWQAARIAQLEEQIANLTKEETDDAKPV